MNAELGFSSQEIMQRRTNFKSYVNETMTIQLVFDNGWDMKMGALWLSFRSFDWLWSQYVSLVEFWSRTMWVGRRPCWKLRQLVIEIFLRRICIKKKGLNKLATIPVTTQGAIKEENKVLIILKKLKILIHAQRLENIINIHIYIFIASSPRGFSESTLQL